MIWIGEFGVCIKTICYISENIILIIKPYKNTRTSLISNLKSENMKQEWQINMEDEPDTFLRVC